MAKATDTPSESCIWKGNRPENATYRLCSNPTAIGANTGFEDAAASKGFDSNLPPSVQGTIRERGNRSTGRWENINGQKVLNTNK
jgi:hypothetical protein